MLLRMDVSVGSTSKNRLTPEDALRALYIDFEGRKDQPPVLLGCTRRSRLGEEQQIWQAVTDLRFAPLAQGDDIEAMTLSDAVERILQRAERRDRRIVAWSEHELDIVRKYCPDKLERFEIRYVNARAVAVHWRNRCHGGRRPSTNTLADYLTLIGYVVPPAAGVGRAGETIRILTAALEKGRRVSELTPNQRRRWSDLREHNRHDCVGMRKVSLLAAREVAEPDQARTSRTPLATVGAFRVF